jgi:hypothetical protein
MIPYGQTPLQTRARTPRRHIARCVPIGLVAASACALAVLPACRSRSPGRAPVQPATASPVVRGADRGLEIWSWIVADNRQLSVSTEHNESQAAPDLAIAESANRPGQPAATDKPVPPVGPIRVSVSDDRADIESLLAPYLDRPVPMSAELLDRWRASGFRIVAVPIADLERLQAACRSVGQMQRQWLGDVTDWTDAVRGPTLVTRRAVTLDDGVMNMEPGQLRLLVRCWAVPAGQGPDGATPAIHLDIAPRHDPLVPERDRMLAAAGVQQNAQPHFLARLAASLIVREETALVFIPEKPSADWKSPTPTTIETERGPFGPIPAAPPSLGEVMFSSQATRDSPRSRAVIAMIIHVPARFDLLPR